MKKPFYLDREFAGTIIHFESGIAVVLPDDWSANYLNKNIILMSAEKEIGCLIFSVNKLKGKKNFKFPCKEGKIEFNFNVSEAKGMRRDMIFIYQTKIENYQVKFIYACKKNEMYLEKNAVHKILKSISIVK